MDLIKHSKQEEFEYLFHTLMGLPDSTHFSQTLYLKEKILQLQSEGDVTMLPDQREQLRELEKGTSSATQSKLNLPITTKEEIDVKKVVVPKKTTSTLSKRTSKRRWERSDRVKPEDETKLQEEIEKDLASMLSSFKTQAKELNKTIHEDTNILDEFTTQLESSLTKTSTLSAKLETKLNQTRRFFGSSIFQYLFAFIAVFISIMVSKLLPKF